jgi:hypothetical protein
MKSGDISNNNPVYMLRRDEIVSPVPLNEEEQEIFDRVAVSRELWAGGDLDLLASYAKAVVRLRAAEDRDPPPSGRVFIEYIAAVKHLADLLAIAPKSRVVKSAKSVDKPPASDADKIGMMPGGAVQTGSFSAPWHGRAS